MPTLSIRYKLAWNETGEESPFWDQEVNYEIVSWNMQGGDLTDTIHLVAYVRRK